MGRNILHHLFHGCPDWIPVDVAFGIVLVYPKLIQTVKVGVVLLHREVVQIHWALHPALGGYHQVPVVGGNGLAFLKILGLGPAPPWCQKGSSSAVK